MEQRSSGDERLAAICQKIRNETLEPAEQEAQNIKLNAEHEASKIKAAARQQADQLLHDARKQLHEERQAFESSLQQACKQTIDLLRQKVETTLFKPALSTWLETEFSSEEKTAKLLDTLIEFLKKEGMEGDLSAWIGSHLSKEQVVKHLATSSLKALPKDGIRIADQAQGVLLKLADKHLTFEVTPDSLKEVIGTFIRSDFRRFLFDE
jgi:V/A-type H+/Na+-transporting ATPase subunit E